MNFLLKFALLITWNYPSEEAAKDFPYKTINGQVLLWKGKALRFLVFYGKLLVKLYTYLLLTWRCQPATEPRTNNTAPSSFK